MKKQIQRLQVLIGMTTALAAITPNTFAATPQKNYQVIVFLSARCPCSASHEPELATLAKTYGPQGFEFIGVHANADESHAESKTHFDRSGLPFAIQEDPQGTWLKRFPALKTPHAFVIDQRSQVVFEGGVTDSSHAPEAKRHFLKDALEELSQKKPVTQPRARTLGCMIKRS